MCALYSDSANLRWPATALKINKHDLTVLVQRVSEKPLTGLPVSSLVAVLRRIEVVASGKIRRSEPEQYDHWPATMRTLPVGPELGLSRQNRGYRHTGRKQMAAQSEPVTAESVGKKAEMPDADESLRQYMQEETAQELSSVQCHFALLAGMRIILPAEGDALAIIPQQTVIRNGDPVCVTTQIA